MIPKISIISALLCTAMLADSISIDMNEFAKISAPSNTLKKSQKRDSIVELRPLQSIPTMQSSVSNAASPKKFNSGNAKEDSRDELLRNLRKSLETGKDFKYYFPNFDYNAYKKDVESMMKDIVSQ